ncbi:MAG: hypothetical protein IJ881_01940 [Neisseriaceae bacterium]|nr:hypothetical protein [Neisseriaceae bacterium]
MEQLSRNIVKLFEQYSFNTLFKNISAKYETYHFHQYKIPLTIVDKIYPTNCWTVSPYSNIIQYSKDETNKLPKFLKYIFLPIISLFDIYLKIFQIEKNVAVYNFCFSTNIISPKINNIPIDELTQQLSQRFSKHALQIRSLNSMLHQDFMKKLKQNGYQFMVSRQVYISDDMQYVMRKKDMKNDFKLLQDKHYSFRQILSNNPYCDFQKACQLYNQLYLEKYSQNNVQFSAEFMQYAVNENVMQLWLLENQNHEALGVAGWIENDEVMTMPVLGYDTTRSTDEALYRRLTAFATQYAVEKCKIFHQSAGVPQFKKTRGATPHIEYSAIFTKHLPLYRRLAWQGIIFISQKIYAPMLKKWQL